MSEGAEGRDPLAIEVWRTEADFQWSETKVRSQEANRLRRAVAPAKFWVFMGDMGATTAQATESEGRLGEKLPSLSPPSREMKFWNRVTPERVVIAGTILAALAYCRDLRYDFILDDLPLILMNDRISSWHNWKTILVSQIMPSSSPVGLGAIHYRPVYVFWTLLNHQLFGYVLPWWHLSSLLLHMAVTLLVYQLGVKVLRQPWAAALGALLFAFHPIHAESVAYASSSTDLLVALFSITAILTYLEFRERQNGMWLLFSVASGALAMFSKENAVVLPAMIIACEYLADFSKKDEAPGWRRLSWSLPYFGIVAGYLLIRTWLFGTNLGPGPGESRIAASLQAPLILLVYLKNLFWPVSLSFFYPIEWSAQWTILKAVGLTIAIAIFLVVWLRQSAHHASRLLLAWMAILFALPLGSAVTFLKEDWVHDRHMYLVSVPLCLLIAAIVTSIEASRRLRLAVASSLVLALLTLLVIQLPRFQDEASIYSSALKVAPDNVLAHQFYAASLWSHDHHEQAFQEFRRVIELRPNSPEGHEAYAGALGEAGKNEESLAEYQAALNLSPRMTRYRAYLLYRVGSLELGFGDSVSGTTHLQQAVAIDPKSLNYHAELARAFRAAGRIPEATEQARLEAMVRADALQRAQHAH